MHLHKNHQHIFFVLNTLALALNTPTLALALHTLAPINSNSITKHSNKRFLHTHIDSITQIAPLIPHGHKLARKTNRALPQETIIGTNTHLHLRHACT